MDQPKPSATALIAAFLRAYHARSTVEPIFDDAIAQELFSHDEWHVIAQNLARAVAFFDPEFAAGTPTPEAALARVAKLQSTPISLTRARYAEEALTAAVAAGVTQYVLLGAGYDTFAVRRSDLAPHLQIFEVDRPATQDDKRARMKRAGWGLPESLAFVAVDFATDDIARALERHGFEARKPAVFSWLGVSYYLAAEAFFDTVEAVLRDAVPGTRLIFDHVDADGLSSSDPRVSRMVQAAAIAGEPMRFGIDPERLGRELSGRGMRLVESLSPTAIAERYFAGRADGWEPLAHMYLAQAERP